MGNTLTPRSLDTDQMEAMLSEIDGVPAEVDGISMLGAKRDASFKLAQAINSIKSLRKLSTPGSAVYSTPGSAV